VYTFGLLSGFLAILIINGIYLVYTYQWNWVSIGSSSLGVLAYLIAYAYFATTTTFGFDLFGTIPYHWGAPATWLYLMLTFFLVFAPAILFNYIRRYYSTQYAHVLQEECHIKEPHRKDDDSLSFTVWQEHCANDHVDQMKTRTILHSRKPS